MLGQEPGFSKEVFANAIFTYSLMYALGQFAMGALADRFGARRVVTAGMLVSGAASVAMAAWTTPAAIIALQALNGLAQSCGWSGLVKTIANWFPRRSRGVVMAWWANNYALGGFAATIFATFAATGPVLAAFGWKRAAVAPGLLLGALGLVFATLVRNRPEDAGLPATETGPPEERLPALAPLAQVARQPDVRVLASGYFFVKLTRYALLFWLPLYLVERLGYSNAQAGYMSSVYELAGFAGVLASGYLSDRVFQARRFPVASLFLLLLAAACTLPVSLATLGPSAVGAGIALIGARSFGADTLIGGAATQDAATPATAASAAGFVNGVGSTGQLLSPYLVAWTVQRFGWDMLFIMLMLFAAAGGLLLATRWREAAVPREAAWQSDGRM